MNEQKIAQEGSPRDLFETPADEFVADFICNANLVSGEVRGHESGHSGCLFGDAASRVSIVFADHGIAIVGTA